MSKEPNYTFIPKFNEQWRNGSFIHEPMYDRVIRFRGEPITSLDQIGDRYKDRSHDIMYFLDDNSICIENPWTSKCWNRTFNSSTEMFDFIKGITGVQLHVNESGKVVE